MRKSLSSENSNSDNRCCGRRYSGAAGSPLVKRRVAGVKILGVQMILSYSYAVAESLIVNYLALAEEFYRVAHVGIVCQTENVIVGRSRFLLCYYHVFATKLSLIKVRKILIL